MSGWVVAFSGDGAAVDANRWAKALRWLEPELEISSSAGTGWRLAAWRRKLGEFPLSGRIHACAGGKLAWLGQTLEDVGDTTAASVEVVGSGLAGDLRLAELNGPFAAALVKAGERECVLWTDRYRHYPVYVHRRGPLLVAGTDIRAVLPLVEEPRIDPDALDLLLRTGELIDRMTLFREVELLPPATALSASHDGVRERRYWQMRHTGDHRGAPEEIAEEIGDTLRRAVRRVERVTPRLVITLSGGLDSRFILGLCEHPDHVPSCTWGLPECRDIAYAGAFARRVGSPHTVRHWQPEAFPPLWETGALLTAGSFGVDSMYMLPFTGLLQGLGDVVLNGLAGDVFLGGNFLKRSWIEQRDLRALAGDTWRWRVSPEQDAMADALVGRRDGAARELWMESICRGSQDRPIDRLNDWLYENRIFRSTNSGTMLLRQRVESHAPFFDREVADVLLRVPAAMKLKHRLYLRVMNRVCPAAAAVPWQRTAVPPGWGFYPNLISMGIHRLARGGLRRLGVEPFPRVAVAEPAAWLRGAWRACAEAIVLDERTFSRGWLSPDEVRMTLKRHLQGEDATRALSCVIAAELACRALLDGDTVTRVSPEAVGVSAV